MELIISFDGSAKRMLYKDNEIREENIYGLKCFLRIQIKFGLYKCSDLFLSMNTNQMHSDSLFDGNVMSLNLGISRFV